MSAILGGSQSLHVNSRDEALALPSEDSVQLSLRTQQILAFESGAADVVDPLGGSYYIESLTNELESQALEYIQQIDDIGGAVEAIEQGFQVREIGDSAYRHGQEVESGDRTVVGVNRFTTEEVPIEGLMRVNEEAAKSQVGRLERLRQCRDDSKVRNALERLKQVAQTDDNTVPAILECVENYCTLGEICEVLRGVFGEQDGTLSF